MTTLERFQTWFTSQCDGEWEHGFAIKIESLDNPGWRTRIHLEGTDFEGKSFESIKDDRTEKDWIRVWIDNSNHAYVFNIACGPENLEEAITLFCDWAKVPK